MDIQTIERIIENHRAGHAEFVSKAMTAERYYDGHSAILDQPRKDTDADATLHNADNRIPTNFHELLVNQKVSYLFTVPPTFDVGIQSVNDRVLQALGDEYTAKCAELCINASNTSVAWVHYWRDKADGSFQWAVVDSKQVVPVYNKALDKKLIGLLRMYTDTDDEGTDWMIYEYWDETYVQSFRTMLGKYDDSQNLIEPYYCFRDPVTEEPLAYYEHGFGNIPFIEFRNNNRRRSDLDRIKRLIDVYDKVYSGFVNDLDDIQEIIFILSGYGGEDLSEFLQNLKKYKTIKVNEDGDSTGAGVSTLSIEIPIEARDKLLTLTRKAIFEQGQGFDPQPENFGNQSGEALKFMYALLEMKASFMEIQFRTGFNKLIRAICGFSGESPAKIVQTWTRTRIKNDSELSEICRNSVGIVSQKTILKNHPFVQDVEMELKQLDAEKMKEQEQADIYDRSFFTPQTGSGDVNGEEGQSKQ